MLNIIIHNTTILLNYYCVRHMVCIGREIERKLLAEPPACGSLLFQVWITTAFPFDGAPSIGGNTVFHWLTVK